MVATATVVAQANTDYGSPTAARTTDAPFTPAANSKLIVVAGSVDATHATAKSWTVSGGGLSWSLIANSADSETPVFSATDTTWGATVWWADVGASPSSMDVTVDPHATTDQGFPGFTVFEVLGATPGVAGNVQAAVAGFATNPTPVSVSLGSGLTAGSVVLGGWFLLSDGGTSAWDGTVPSGWTRTVITTVAGVSVAGLISSTQNSLTYGSSANTAYSAGFLIEIGEASAAATVEQEGFRWHEDGTESGSTPAQAQDVDDTVDVGTARILRIILNGDGDAASITPTLRAQKNGAGGWELVPVGPGTAPTISYAEAGSDTDATGDPNPTYPAGVTSLSELVLITSSKPSTANGGTLADPSGWTRRGDMSGATDGDTGGYGGTVATDTGNMNLYVLTKDTVAGDESGSLGAVNHTGQNNATAGIFRLEKSGPGTVDWAVATGKDTSAGAFSATLGTIDLAPGDLVLWALAIPTDVTTPSQFSGHSITASGITFSAVTEVREWDSTSGTDQGGLICAATVTAGSGSVAPTVGATTGGTTTNVRGPVVLLRARPVAPVNELYIASSANITDGEATTNRETAPAGKDGSDWIAGEIRDAANATSALDLGADQWSTVAFSVNTQSPAVDTDFWTFRIYNGATPLDTYAEDPVLTLGSGGGTAYERTVNDGSTAGDALARLVDSARARADVGTAVDARTRTTETVRGPADAGTADDALAAAQGHGRDLVDTAGGSDVVVRETAAARSRADTSTATDAASRVIAAVRALTEAPAGTDAVTRAVVAAAVLADTGTATDVFVRIFGAARGPLDTAAGTDTVARALTVARAVADAAAGSDALSRVVAFLRSVGDAGTVADLLDHSHVPAGGTTYELTVNDASTATDTLSRIHAAARALADVDSASDTLSRSLAWARALADLDTPTDTTSRVAAQGRALSDVDAAVDTLARSTAQIRGLASVAAGSDDVEAGLAIMITLADSALGSDSLVRGLAALRTLSDASEATDTAERLLDAVRALLDAAAVDDAIASVLLGGIKADVADCVILVQPRAEILSIATRATVALGENPTVTPGQRCPCS